VFGAKKHVAMTRKNPWGRRQKKTVFKPKILNKKKTTNTGPERGEGTLLRLPGRKTGSLSSGLNGPSEKKVGWGTM